MHGNEESNILQANTNDIKSKYQLHTNKKRETSNKNMNETKSKS